MDTGETPPPSAFTIEVDGTDKVPDSVQWLNNRVFQLNYTEASLGPVVVRCILDKTEPAFHAVGFQPVSPFDILGTEQTFTGVWFDDDPDVLITLTTNLPLFQSPTTELSVWEISWASFSSPPESIDIPSVNEIDLELENVGPPSGQINAELLSVFEDYKTTAGLFLCPFLLSNIPQD